MSEEMTPREELEQQVDEAIKEATGGCCCADVYSCRDMADPSCTYHNTDIKAIADLIESREKALIRAVEAQRLAIDWLWELCDWGESAKAKYGEDGYNAFCSDRFNIPANAMEQYKLYQQSKTDNGTNID